MTFNTGIVLNTVNIMNISAEHKASSLLLDCHRRQYLEQSSYFIFQFSLFKELNIRCIFFPVWIPHANHHLHATYIPFYPTVFPTEWGLIYFSKCSLLFMVSVLQNRILSQELAQAPLSLWDPSPQTLFPGINTDSLAPLYLFSSKQARVCAWARRPFVRVSHDIFM